MTDPALPPGEGTPPERGDEMRAHAAGSGAAPAPPDEPDESPGFAGEMGRLFLIPAVIVALSVLVFLLFGWIAGERRDAHDYLQEVRNGATGRKWQAAFELSRALTSDESARRDPTLAKEIASTLVDPRTEDPLIRRYLLLALEEIDDPSTASQIRSSLSDKDSEVRLFAIRALGRLQDREAVPALVEILQGDDPALRKMALYALGQIGDTGAIPAMQARLDDPVEDVRWNAALALAVLRDGSGAPVIRQMLDPAHLDGVEGITEAQKIDARINAVQAAYLLGGDDMRALVERVGREDASLKVRDVALRAIDEWK